MKRGCWGDACLRACLAHRHALLGRLPRLSVVSSKQDLIPTVPSAEVAKKRNAFAGEDDAARSTSLADVDCDGARIGIEIADLQAA